MGETICLQRPNEQVPWGFRLQGGRDFQQPLSVQKVTSGSIAANNLGSGDVILRIGDVETASLTHSQAMIMIKNCGNTLDLGVSKGGGGGGVNTVPMSPQVFQPRTTYQGPTTPLNDYPSPSVSYPFGEPLSYDSGLNHSSPVSNGGQQPIYGGGDYGDLDSSYSSDTPAQPPPQRMPDAILNMAAKGESDKKPFSYIADVNAIKEQRDKVKKKTPLSTLPRYQHVLNLPHFEDAPRSRGLPRTPATPPIQTPPSDSGDAVVANLQFNTPLGLYSNDNVVEALKGQTGGIVTDLIGLSKKDKTDITQSPVYKMIHGIDQPRPKPVVKFVEAQPAREKQNVGGSEIDSSSIRHNVSGGEEEPGSYDEKSIRYTGRNIPSKSFRLLQSMTGGSSADNSPPPVHRQLREPSSDDETRFGGLNRVQRLQDKTRASPGRGSPAGSTGGGSSEIDRSSIRHNVLGDDLQNAGEYEQTSIRYTGRNIPSKSFRMLQSMTGGADSSSPPPAHPASHPMRRQQQRRPPPQQQYQQQQQPEPETEKQNPDDVVDIRYVGGQIPSKSFRFLQHCVGDSTVQTGNASDTMSSTQGRKVKVTRLRQQSSQEDTGSTEF